MYHLSATRSPSNIFTVRARATAFCQYIPSTCRFRHLVLSLSLHLMSHRHQNLRLPKYMHTKILMYSFIRHLLLMDVTSRFSQGVIKISTREKKLNSEKVDVL
jgi:hypothetical protein